MSEGPFIKFQEVFQHPADLQEALNDKIKISDANIKDLKQIRTLDMYNHNFFLTRCCLEQNQPRETPMDFLYCNILPFPTPILNSAEVPPTIFTFDLLLSCSAITFLISLSGIFCLINAYVITFLGIL
ncbi:hypothetical protein GQR58_014658 [Nymphon striatum]|nr:hypothetical protein GQR58_014658 [Nymphon striatum]